MIIDITRYNDPAISSTEVVIRDVPLTVTACPVCGAVIGPMPASLVVCPRRHQTAVSNG